uniref:RNase III domain-containing protein n=1 Tax=Panagrolaimus sp. ES5 TaxID=591445 RepID=A0AC34G506_9BILA
MTRKRLSGQKKATAALIIAKPVAQHVLPTSTESDPKRKATAALIIAKPVAQHVLPTSTESDPKRLSSIGVSFLKFTISHKIFHSYPNSNEGKLTRKYEVEVSKFKQWKLYDSVGNYIILEGVEKCYTIVEPFVISEKNASGKLKSPPSNIDSEFYGRQFQNIEATIEYEFRDRALLLQAFSHQSYKHVSKFGSYERLEFL